MAINRFDVAALFPGSCTFPKVFCDVLQRELTSHPIVERNKILPQLSFICIFVIITIARISYQVYVCFVEFILTIFPPCNGSSLAQAHSYLYLCTLQYIVKNVYECLGKCRKMQHFLFIVIYDKYDCGMDYKTHFKDARTEWGRKNLSHLSI